MTTKAVNILGCVGSAINEQAKTVIPVLDNIDAAAFDSMMNESLLQAKAGQGLPLAEAVEILEKVYSKYENRPSCMSCLK